MPTLTMSLLGVALTLCAALATAARIDPVASHIGFTLKTRWGQVLEGRFPDAQGDVVELHDGHHQVRLQLATRTVEILGHDAYTRLTRGDGFFDADEYPWVQFVSDEYSADLLRDGGALTGVLTIRNVHRREVFTISPSSCAQPARQCDVIASGVIRRQDYGVNRWSFAMSDKVRFTLRVRVSDEVAHE
jgi:polyisoprenoid-binding protein YceI